MGTTIMLVKAVTVIATGGAAGFVVGAAAAGYALYRIKYRIKRALRKPARRLPPVIELTGRQYRVT